MFSSKNFHSLLLSEWLLLNVNWATIKKNKKINENRHIQSVYYLLLYQLDRKKINCETLKLLKRKT